MGMFSDLAELAPKPKSRKAKKAEPKHITRAVEKIEALTKGKDPRATLNEEVAKVVSEALLFDSKEVEQVISNALESGDYNVVDVGLTAPAETPVEEVEQEIDPLLLQLLETIATDYDGYSVQGKLSCLNALNDIINKNSKEG